jgi:hypothetical protein
MPSSLETLRELLAERNPSTPDALASIDLPARERIASFCDAKSADTLIRKATATRDAIVARLRSNTPALDQLPENEAAALELHVFREALGRLLKTELETTRREIEFIAASPVAVGARFDLLRQQQGDGLREFMQNGFVVVPNGLFPNKPLAWAELLRKDVDRAKRVGECTLDSPLQCSSGVCAERYPAVFAVADRLACLPRELNYKTNEAWFGEVVGRVCVYEDGSHFSLEKDVVTAGYWFASSNNSSTAVEPPFAQSNAFFLHLSSPTATRWTRNQSVHTIIITFPTTTTTKRTTTAPT